MGISLVGGWMSEAGVEENLKQAAKVQSGAGPWPMLLLERNAEWIRIDANGVWTRRTAAVVHCSGPVMRRGGAPDDGAKKSKSVSTRSGKLPYTA
ncbi:hypothetical protein NEUTE2DRAFT_67955 [Neurospora tetrasperma FGSC 2509]|nr:hypothetical protein NEUTE2DRAFT_67955 [Neurospora tetrasperma FGSC 2509]